MKKSRSLIALIEDTPDLSALCKSALSKDGYDVVVLSNGNRAVNYIQDNVPDLFLLNLDLPDMDGLEILKIIKREKIKVPVIVTANHDSIEKAADALRHGARSFLLKPFNTDQLQMAIRSEFENDSLYTMPATLAGTPFEEEEDTTQLPHTSKQKAGNSRINLGAFIGSSLHMNKIYAQIEAAARSNATVFITGESGTGKEICAETIHKNSARAEKPFVPINCAAIPRDLMESELFGHVKGAFTGAISDREGAASLANGGTLFLDEVAEMNPDIQSKLLRFLQSLSFQKVGGNKIEKTDVRIICATNKNPIQEIAAGRFREDLFYRLHVLPIYMPPLRKRGTDILDIAMSSLRLYSAEEGKSFKKFSAEAQNLLLTYRWPGNIRQLQNIIRNIVVMYDSTQIETAMLPPELFNDKKDSESNENSKTKSANFISHDALRPLSLIEQEIIENAISLCQGNIQKAASALHVAPSTIYRKKASWEDHKKNKTQL